MKNDNMLVKLVFAVGLGSILGLFATETVISVISIVKYSLGQIIFFTIPLIIIAFVGSAIAKLQNDASKLLSCAILIAYLSTVGAGFMSFIAGNLIIPRLNIQNNITELNALPEMIFKIDVPQIMPVMSALVLAIIIGLSISWSKSQGFMNLICEFQEMILSIIHKIILPILPIFIGATFAELMYEGAIINHLPVFIGVILIVIVGHFIWLGVLFFVAGAYTKTNPYEVFRHYLPTYFTAVGTMSSAATLPMSLKSANQSSILRKDIVSFGIPLFTNIHLCGSVLTEVFFVMVVSKVLYGDLPSVANMILFVVLLGLFGIGAPGVPGGTVMASLGLITGILGFDTAGTALMLTIFALQDSFGTACNVTGDGALTMILNKFANKLDVDK